MSAETIIRHTCDQCGKTQDEKQTSWLPCGVAGNWSGWSIKKEGTASHFYGTVGASKEFCSHDCAIEFLTKEKEWQQLTQ